VATAATSTANMLTPMKFIGPPPGELKTGAESYPGAGVWGSEICRLKNGLKGMTVSLCDARSI